MPGNHYLLENPCITLEQDKDICKKEGKKCWPSYLNPQLKELIHDRRITPDEFDDELYELKVSNHTKLTKLMKEVQQHPIMWT